MTDNFTQFIKPTQKQYAAEGLKKEERRKEIFGALLFSINGYSTKKNLLLFNIFPISG